MAAAQDGVSSANQPGGTFAKILDWHLRHGTRPPGDPKSGLAWGKEDFAECLGVDERTVRNWRSGRGTPVTEILSIERELFGLDPANDSPIYAAWRAQLRDAYGAAKASDRRRIGSASPEGGLPEIVGEMPHRLPIFVGRDEQLDGLHAILIQKRPAVATIPIERVAVHGLPGVGKTVLAVEYANRNRHFYAGICWLSAETNSGILTGLAALAVALRVATPQDSDIQSSAEAALRKLESLKTVWLLIYDNVKEPNAIADLVPRAGAHVLITSRFHDWAEFADEVALDIMTSREAISFLQRRSGFDDERGAKALAEALDHLPLALDHAAALCKLRRRSFPDYTARVGQLITVKPPKGVSYPRSVLVTFTLAIETAMELCSSAKDLITYLGFCAPDPVPVALLGGAIGDEGERTAAIDALVQVSLVSYESSDWQSAALRIHRLVQEVARINAQENNTARQFTTRLILRLLAIYPGDAHQNPKSWPLCAQLTPHLFAQRGVQLKESSDPLVWAALLTSAGGYFQGRVAYGEAAALLSEALAIVEATFGPNHPETATPLNNVAGLLRAASDFERARPYCERALKIRLQHLGDMNPATALSFNNLGNVLTGLKDFAGARVNYERALIIQKTIYGPTHPETANAINNLANVFVLQGEFVRAREHYERALAIYQLTFGAHPFTATCLQNIGRAYKAGKEYVMSEQYYEQAIEMYDLTLGSEHPTAYAARASFAEMLTEGGKPDKAFSIASRALLVLDKVLGPNHLWTLFAATVTANALEVLSRPDEARALRATYGINPSDVNR